MKYKLPPIISPITAWKVISAKKDYLRHSNTVSRKGIPRTEDNLKAQYARDWLHTVASDRYEFYTGKEKFRKAELILKLATTKKNATIKEARLLNTIRHEILGTECLVEPACLS